MERMDVAYSKYDTKRIKFGDEVTKSKNMLDTTIAKYRQFYDANLQKYVVITSLSSPYYKNKYRNMYISVLFHYFFKSFK